MFSVSLPDLKSVSVNLDALIPFSARASFSLLKSSLVKALSNLASISSYKRESSIVQPSTLGCIPSSLITSKTRASVVISASFNLKLRTSPLLPLAYSLA